MRPVNVSLGVGQEFNLGGLVKKIKVRQAIGPIVVKTPSESAPLDLGETITFEQATDQVQIINTHDAANTLELIVISSDEGSLDAAASSVAVSNAEDIKGAPSDYTRQEFWNIYKVSEFTTPAMWGSKEINQASQDQNMIQWAITGNFIERMDIEVVNGEVALFHLPLSPDLITYQQVLAQDDDLTGTYKLNPTIPGNISLEMMPRYYAGERIHFDYRDRIQGVYAYCPAGKTNTLRCSWNLLQRRV